MKKIIIFAGVFSLLSAVHPAGATETSIAASCVVQSTAHLAAANVSVADDLVADACRSFEEVWTSRHADDDTEVPTILMAWPSAGVTSDAGAVGFPVSGVCTLGGAFTSPTTVQYALVGHAESVGPATRTKITCGGAGMTATGDMIGPAAAGFSTAVGPLAATQVCTVARGWFVDGSSTTSRQPAGCSPRVTI